MNANKEQIQFHAIHVKMYRSKENIGTALFFRIMQVRRKCEVKLTSRKNISTFSWKGKKATKWQASGDCRKPVPANRFAVQVMKTL